MLHVQFTRDGIPAWIGDQARDGSEEVEGLSVEFLAAHRRTTKGTWVARSLPVPVVPTAEELAAEAEAGFQAALVARDEALRTALAAEADPQFFRWQRGECAKEDWLAAVAEVKARHPKPSRP